MELTDTNSDTNVCTVRESVTAIVIVEAVVMVNFLLSSIRGRLYKRGSLHGI